MPEFNYSNTNNREVAKQAISLIKSLSPEDRVILLQELSLTVTSDIDKSYINRLLANRKTADNNDIDEVKL